MKWIVILLLEFIIMYTKVKNLVTWNHHEFGVLMNGSVKCVEDQSKNNECMPMKCKFVVTVVWNNYARIQFHFYHKSMIANGGWFTKTLKILLDQIKKGVALVLAYFVQFFHVLIFIGNVKVCDSQNISKYRGPER